MSLYFNRRKAFRGGSGASWPSSKDTELVRYFRMEESSGNLYDEISASSYTVAGATFTYEQTGIENNGINFGTDSECQIGAPMNGATSGMWSWWANTVTASTTQYFFHSGGATGAHIYHNASSIIAAIGSPNVQAAKPANGMHHFVVFWNGTLGEQELYIDGVLVDSTPTSTPVASLSTSDETIGSDNFSTNSTKCIMDEVALWADITFVSGAERQTFVDDLYNSGTGTFYP